MKSFSSFLKIKTNAKKAPSRSLVPGAARVWKYSLLVLVLALCGIVVADAYVFINYVQELDRTYSSAPNTEVPNIKDALLSEAQQILSDRARAFSEARENLPTRNPFRATGGIKP